MKCTNNSANIQFPLSTSGFIAFPSKLAGFIQTGASIETSRSGNEVCVISGLLETTPNERICPYCGNKMHIKDTKKTVLRDVPHGSSYVDVCLDQKRFYCEHCHHSHMQEIPFKDEHHRITLQLRHYIEDLLERNTFTLKAIAEIAGVGQHTVKSIDKDRLSSLYVQDDKLKTASAYSRYLSIDEFKLHNGHQYATHIIDLETGHILWIARGKKKQVVYDFIDAYGMEWMDHVEAVACDMNSDFQEAFEERCEWISIVYDHFHIVKNFNDKVISLVRIDEQKRLKAEGRDEQARNLKNSKFILTSSYEKLHDKDKKGEASAVLRAENTLFGIKPVIAKTGYVKRYNNLIKENALLMACDIVKELLKEAYECRDENEMADKISQIIDICRGTKNKHFQWFARLLENHFEGIIAHATYRISSGRIEGINNKIKTIRRLSYGFRDDSYFFLKIMDASYHQKIRNPKSHRVFH